MSNVIFKVINGVIFLVKVKFDVKVIKIKFKKLKDGEDKKVEKEVFEVFKEFELLL